MCCFSLIKTLFYTLYINSYYTRQIKYLFVVKKDVSILMMTLFLYNNKEKRSRAGDIFWFTLCVWKWIRERFSTSANLNNQMNNWVFIRIELRTLRVYKISIVLSKLRLTKENARKIYKFCLQFLLELLYGRMVFFSECRVFW